MFKIKITTFSLLLILLFANSCSTSDYMLWNKDHNLSVMSFNVRFDTTEDGENQWDNRKEACLSMWRETSPSIVGVQEALHNQVNYFNDNLPDYDYVGVGRDDGHSSGEYAAIFYKTADFEVLETNSFWLSETPDYPSLGWDANNIRIVTWAHFRDRNTNQTFSVYNTHLDHLGKTSQTESTKMIIQRINEMTAAEDPVFLVGDFNMLIGNSRMKPITDEFFDARKYAGQTDNEKSFHLWGKWWFPDRNIDFIFYKNAVALSFKTITKNYGVPHLSDHRPLLAHFDYVD